MMGNIPLATILVIGLIMVGVTRIAAWPCLAFGRVLNKAAQRIFELPETRAARLQAMDKERTKALPAESADDPFLREAEEEVEMLLNPEKRFERELPPSP